MVKNCDLRLEMLPLAYGLRQYFQDLGHSFSAYGPASRQITYILYMKCTGNSIEKKNTDFSVKNG